MRIKKQDPQQQQQQEPLYPAPPQQTTPINNQIEEGIEPQQQQQQQQQPVEALQGAEGVVYKFSKHPLQQRIASVQQQSIYDQFIPQQQQYNIQYPTIPAAPPVYTLSVNDFMEGMPSLYPHLQQQEAPPSQNLIYPHLQQIAPLQGALETGQGIVVPSKDLQQEKKTELPAFVIHELEPEDTLISIALSYGVTVEDIKLRNAIFNDDLAFFDKPEVIIPYPSLLPAKRVKIIDVKDEEKKKEVAVRTFSFMMKCTDDESRYYLLLHDWNWVDALAEYQSDIKWQKEQEAIKEEKEERRRTHKPGIIAETFGVCFPGILQANVLDDEYTNLELDQIQD